MHSQTNPAPTKVIALHCSGAGAGQWKTLAAALGRSYAVDAPEHYGCDSTGHWTGEHAFTLADEAARTVHLIDRCVGKIHLVGHSYGGGLALHVALTRPERIASLSLYEPSAFHLLKAFGLAAHEAFAEIAAITAETSSGIVTGDYRSAAVAFIDYWAGGGAFANLRPSVQSALIRWIPKAPLDFRALIEEGTPVAAYAALGFPVLVMRGELAPAPTRQIAEMLPSLLADARAVVVEGAGHMGPITHAEAVAAEIARHIRQAEESAQARTQTGSMSERCLGRHMVAA
jgi:pimeloyl-ACP methyl ester carboxylesterase